MKQIITTIDREAGYNYSVNKQGEVIKESYNLFKDKTTLITIAIIILGLLFYLQISQMKTTEKNFESSCLQYIELRNKWMLDNPGEIPTLEQVFNQETNSEINITIINNE